MSDFPPARLAWLIWGLGACLYLIGFFQRVATGVMGGELMREFGIGAAMLGNLSAVYFYSYVAMQVPTGILADRWGPRRLLTAGALAAGLGGLLFALSPGPSLAMLGRLLVGGSVAVAFVGMMKLAGHWLAPRQFAFAAGVAVLVGVFGGLVAGLPLALAIEALGWRPIMAAVAAVTLVLALAIWLRVRDDPGELGYRSHAMAAPADGEGFLRGLRRVAGFRNTWLLVLTPAGLVGPALAFTGLWGVPFLVSHYGMRESTAALYCSGLLVIWALSGPLLGGLSDRLGHRKPLHLICCVCGLLGWGLVVLSPPASRPLLLVGLMLAGFAAGIVGVSFAYARESVPGRYAGTIGGLVNMGIMLGPMLLQPAIGWVLDRNWSGLMEAGVRIYELGAYRSGFGLMLAWTALSLLLAALTRETHCRPA